MRRDFNEVRRYVGPVNERKGWIWVPQRSSACNLASGAFFKFVTYRTTSGRMANYTARFLLVTSLYITARATVIRSKSLPNSLSQLTLLIEHERKKRGLGNRREKKVVH
jgi:hypothetical protein